MADLIWGSDPCKSLELGRQKPRPSALVTKKTHGGDDDDHHHHHDVDGVAADNDRRLFQHED